MKNDIFKKMIESNKRFWAKANKRDDTNGWLLYEAFYSEPEMIYGISKTALAIAHIKKLKPLCIESLRPNETNYALAHSMNDAILGNKKDFLTVSIKNIFSILKYLLSVNNKQDLLNLKIEQYKIGKYIYDSVLISFIIPEVSKITNDIRKRILLEICYFFYFKNIIERFKIKMIVLGDNTYRYGLLFELAKYNNIDCITPVSINTFSMRKYEASQEFNIIDRTPEDSVLKKLDNDTVKNFLDDYFSKRFTANLEQHDVLKAFSDSKKIYTKDEMVKQYNLKQNIPTVIVMSHIFCDAPHGYPDGLYDDYKEWLEKTVECLKENKNINFLIKEHPSADLYNEKGTINTILKELEAEQYLLKDDVHNLTILNEFDVVITCGGTIGQEFIYKGKPVVLASAAPYGGFGFTTEPKTKEDYESFLSCGVESLALLTDKQKEMANKVIYHDFVLLDNYSDDLELGGQRSYFKIELDYSKFYEQILKYNDIPLQEQKIYKTLKKFIESDNKYLLEDIIE